MKVSNFVKDLECFAAEAAAEGTVVKTENGRSFYFIAKNHERVELSFLSDSEIYETTEAPSNDPVNHPSHYTDGKIEVIDFIEDKRLGFHLGNAVKYIARAGKKDPSKTAQDLEKAKWYLNREINRLVKK